MNDKHQLWLTLAREQYPTLTEEQMMGLSMKAASDWYFGVENELTILYDQYVMLKTLKDIPSNANDSRE